MRKKKFRLAKTIKAAIGKTKLPAHVVQQLRDNGSDAFRANGSVDCDQLLKDAAKLPEAESDEQLNIFVERAKAVKAKRLLDEQKHAERAKLLWPIADVRRAWFANVISCKKKLYSAEHEIAAECLMRGLSPEHAAIVQEAIVKHQRNAIKELHAGELGKVECVKCGSEVAP